MVQQALVAPSTTAPPEVANPDAYVVPTPTTTAPARPAPPAPARASRSRPSEAKGTRPATTTTGDVWAALANCESGGNPKAVSSTGRYRGAFQFSLRTWASVHSHEPAADGHTTGDPIAHTYAEQLAAAKALQARDGWGQWPSCSRKLGLA